MEPCPFQEKCPFYRRMRWHAPALGYIWGDIFQSYCHGLLGPSCEIRKFFTRTGSAPPADWTPLGDLNAEA